MIKVKSNSFYESTLIILFTCYITLAFCNNYFTTPRTNLYLCIILMLIAIFLMLIVHEGIVVIKKNYVKYYGIFFVYVCFSNIWTTYHVHQFRCLPSMGCTIVCAMILNELMVHCSIKHIYDGVILAGCIAGVKMFIVVPFDYFGKNVVELEGVGNRNILGMSLSFVATIALVLFYLYKEKIYITVSIFLFTCVVLTGSRKSLIFGCMILTFMVVLSRFSFKKVMIIIFGMVFIFLGTYLMFNNEMLYNAIGYRFSSIFSTFRNGVSKSNDSSVWERLKLIGFSKDIIIKKPVFGWGLNGFEGYLYRFVNWRAVYSHNNYIELLSNFGIVGFLLYYVTYFKGVSIWRKMHFKEDTILLFQVSSLYSILIVELFLVSYYDACIQIIVLMTLVPIFKYGDSFEICKNMHKNGKDLSL